MPSLVGSEMCIRDSSISIFYQVQVPCCKTTHGAQKKDLEKNGTSKKKASTSGIEPPTSYSQEAQAIVWTPVVLHDHLYVRIVNFYILTPKRTEHPHPGGAASTIDAAPGRVGRYEQDQARRSNTTPNGVPHLELGRLLLKTWSMSDFSICLLYTSPSPRD